MADLSAADDVAVGDVEAAGLLEHPQEAFAYYRHEGVPQVICEQKHMGSRAVVILCRDESVSQRRFGVIEPSLGVIYTRTGRRFFNDDAAESAFLHRLRDAAERSGLWEGADHRLDVPRLRVDAMVCESAGVAAAAICPGRQRRHQALRAEEVALAKASSISRSRVNCADNQASGLEG